MMTQKKEVIELKPDLTYDQDECCQILKCSRPTLVRLRRDKQFPLKSIGKGIALGADILKWLATQKDSEQVARPRRKTRKAVASNSK